jgi:hypothetical protein
MIAVTGENPDVNEGRKAMVNWITTGLSSLASAVRFAPLVLPNNPMVPTAPISLNRHALAS